jgi:protein tyrosine phosphatase
MGPHCRANGGQRGSFIIIYLFIKDNKKNMAKKEKAGKKINKKRALQALVVKQYNKQRPHVLNTYKNHGKQATARSCVAG